MLQAISQRCVICRKIAFEMKNCMLKYHLSLGRPVQHCRDEGCQQATQTISFRLGMRVPAHGQVYVLTTSGIFRAGHGVAFGRMAQSLVRLGSSTVGAVDIVRPDFRQTEGGTLP